MSSFASDTVRFVVWLGAYVGAYLAVFADAVRNLRHLARDPGRRLLLKQIYFTGIEALPLLTILALVIGFASLSPLYAVLMQDMALTLSVFRLLVLQEASVLLVAFFVLARSGSAMASELASARQHGEVASIYRMGIDAGEYLVAPRVASAVLSVAALVIYFQVAMVLGGFALMSLAAGWDYSLALGKFAAGIDPVNATLMTAKAMVFGGIIGTISCKQGLLAMPGPLGIPVATRTAMVHGFATIVLAEGLFVFLFGQ